MEPIAVISDIHGNLPALEAVLADAAEQGAKHFLVAGDLAARAPFPVEVLRRVQSLDADVIRGNADQYQIDYVKPDIQPSKRHKSSWGVVRWTDAQIGAEGVAYLASLPEVIVTDLPGMPPIRMLHASPASPNAGLVPYHNHLALEAYHRAGLLPDEWDQLPLEKAINGVPESLLIVGHTHIPWQEDVRMLSVLNPGSVGLPINGDPRAQYALIRWQATGWQIEPRAVPYDWQLLKQAYYTSGILDAGGPFARACMDCALTGENVPWFFILHAHQLAGPDGITDAVQIAAAQSFDWSIYESR